MGQDQVSREVSVLCWLAALVANVVWKPLNLVIMSKSVIRSSLVAMSQFSELSDLWRTSLYAILSQNGM